LLVKIDGGGDVKQRKRVEKLIFGLGFHRRNPDGDYVRIRSIKKGNPRRCQAATYRGFWGGGGLRASAIPYGLTED